MRAVGKIRNEPALGSHKEPVDVSLTPVAGSFFQGAKEEKVVTSPLKGKEPSSSAAVSSSFQSMPQTLTSLFARALREEKTVDYLKMWESRDR